MGEKQQIPLTQSFISKEPSTNTPTSTPNNYHSPIPTIKRQTIKRQPHFFKQRTTFLKHQSTPTFQSTPIPRHSGPFISISNLTHSKGKKKEKPTPQERTSCTPTFIQALEPIPRDPNNPCFPAHHHLKNQQHKAHRNVMPQTITQSTNQYIITHPSLEKRIQEL